MADGNREPGSPARDGGRGRRSLPRRARPSTREEAWAPGWGPQPQADAPRAGYATQMDESGLSVGFDPFPPHAYLPTPQSPKTPAGTSADPDVPPQRVDSGQWDAGPRDGRLGGDLSGRGDPRRPPVEWSPDRPDGTWAGPPADARARDTGLRGDTGPAVDPRTLPRRDTDGRGFSPRDTDGRGLSPRDTDGRGFSPRDTDGHGLSPRDTDGRGFLPRDTDGRGFGPHDTDGLGFAPRDAAMGAPTRETEAWSDRDVRNAPRREPAFRPDGNGRPRPDGNRREPTDEWRRIASGPTAGPARQKEPGLRGGPRSGWNAHTAPRPTPPTRDTPPPPRSDEAPHRPRVGRAILVVVLTAILLGGIGVGAVAWTHRHHGTTPATTAQKPAALPVGDPIASQKTDPKPLSTNEVFGSPTIPSGTGGAYTVVKSESVAECSSVATEKIAALFTTLGCTQAVRATLRSADGTYLITAGIVNLPDEASAATARTSIKSLIGAGSGRFVSLDASGSPSVSSATTHLGWDSRGHFLTYAVIALASGQPISSSDTNTAGIINDVLENYLGATVIGARETN